MSDTEPQVHSHTQSTGYRAVASYVTTVNQLYISLLILGYLRYLSASRVAKEWSVVQ